MKSLTCGDQVILPIVIWLVLMMAEAGNYSLKTGFMCLLEFFHGMVGWREPHGLVWGKGE